ncbi:MAG: transglutaminase-like domain-containing protein [Bacteroidales bacterium]
MRKCSIFTLIKIESKRRIMDHLNILISLLEDPDHEAFTQVSNEILMLGMPAVETLEDAWFNTHDLLTRSRIEEIVHNIQFESLYSEMSVWAASGAQDLLRGYIIASRLQYPNLDEEKVITEINRIVNGVWLELNNNLTSLEKIKVLNHVMFGVHEINGSVADNDVPDCYFINTVLQTKHGNALSIGILYIIVAEKLGLPVKAVDLTGNFIACFTHLPSDFGGIIKPISEIKFYINPLALGSVFTRKEIVLYLEKADIEPTENCFVPASNKTIIKRWCTYLIRAYSGKGMQSKAKELKSFIEILES